MRKRYGVLLAVFASLAIVFTFVNTGAASAQVKSTTAKESISIVSSRSMSATENAAALKSVTSKVAVAAYSKWWVTTFATAVGYYYGGFLYAGYNYVYCKAWGPNVGSSTSYNHWWLWTDMDTGGQDYVSAYYLSYWGNDVAKDNSGHVIPDC